MMFATKTATGLDIGSSFIKLVQLRLRSDRLELVNLALEKISPSSERGASEKEVVEVLRRIIEEKRIKIHTLIIAIPRRLSVVRLISLPSKDERELREMVRFEAERQMPFPLSQMELDFQIIPGPGEDSKVLMGAVQKADIQRHLSLFNQLGLRVETIQLSSFALFNCLTYNREIEEDKVTALLHLGAETTEIGIVRSGSLQFTQCIMEGTVNYIQVLHDQLSISVSKAEELMRQVGVPRGGSIREMKIVRLAESWLDHMVRQIEHSFRAYRAEPDGAEVEELILSGGGANLRNLDSILQERLGMKVRLIDPLRRIEVDSSRFSLSELAPQLPLAIGLALRGRVAGGMEVNLLPQSVTEEKVRQRRRKVRLSSVIGMSIGVLAVVATFIGMFNAKFNRLRVLEEKIATSKPLVEKVEGMNEQLKILTNYSDRSRSSLEILRVLSIVSPPNLYLTSLTFQRNRSVDLAGRADSVDAVYWFRNALQKSGYFDEIELRGPSKEREEVSFGIRCIITAEGSTASP